MTPARAKSERWAGLPSFLVSLALTLGVGAIGGWATASSVTTWYAALNKPAFNPPNGVFGPVWTLLYLIMALAAWRIWRRAPRDRAWRWALGLYATQLVLNLAWSIIFFGLRQPGWALVEVCALLAAVLATAVAFGRRDRLSGLLLVPYAAWVAFATLLTFEIWRLN